jgi:HEAT repeat protein
MKQQSQVDTALLAKVLRTDKDAVVRKSAAWVLQGHREGVPLLIERLRVDPDASVREMAAWGLASMESDEAVAAEAQALKSDRDPEVRATAAWALGNMHRVEVSALEPALSDEDETVRHRALWAIGQHDLAAAPPKVVAMLKDESPSVRHMAAWVLGEIQDHATLPALRDAFLHDSDASAREMEFRALLLMDDRSQDVIDHALNSPDPDLRAKAVRMIAGGSVGAWPWPWPWPWPRPQP